MPSDEQAWVLLHCRECASVSKFDPSSTARPTCPTCRTPLDWEEPPPVPDPNELLEREEEAMAEADAATEVISYQPNQPVLGNQLITDLNPKSEDETSFDTARMKRTTDDELVSPAENRVRIKRQSKRVEKELTSWDDRGEESAEEDPRPSRRRRREARWIRPAKIAALAVVPAAFVCLTAYMVVAAIRNQEAAPPADSPAELARLGLSALESGSLERASSKKIYTEARFTAEAFLKAKSWRDRLPLIREPERVGRLMEAYYANPQNADGPVVHRPIPDEGKVAINQSLLLFSIESPEFETRPLALEFLPDETFVVDWESFVGHCDIPWDELDSRREQTEPFLMRVRAKERDYYNYGFRDDAWVSWQLEDREGNHRVFGYVERNSPEHIELRLMTKGKKGQRKNPVYMLLKVRFPENAPAGDQLEIVEVVTKGWVAPDAYR